jgi:hypothetical protein
MRHEHSARPGQCQTYLPGGHTEAARVTALWPETRTQHAHQAGAQGTTSMRAVGGRRQFKLTPTSMSRGYIYPRLTQKPGSAPPAASSWMPCQGCGASRSNPAMPLPYRTTNFSQTLLETRRRTTPYLSCPIESSKRKEGSASARAPPRGVDGVALAHCQADATGYLQWPEDVEASATTPWWMEGASCTAGGREWGPREGALAAARI